MFQGLIKGILAGLCISIGGTVFLSCESKVVGAIFFCVALLAICMCGFALFTGKVGFLAISHKKNDFRDVLTSLLGNLIGCVLFGLMIQVGVPKLIPTAQTICTAKLAQTVWEALIRAFFCGVLMYLAVWIYRNKNSSLAIFFCVPVFILSGFEHSIANMFYFSVAGFFTWDALLYIVLIVLGNSVGGLLIPLMLKACEKSNN
ncbi:MAG: formate/nitrite transporter family protein [Clostridia bacterium]|nr:formate/nitrite transporter family protein [Clostridia bacterium]